MTDFGRVIGNIFGNILKIVCEDNTSSATISWMIVAERNDSFVKSWTHANSSGSLVAEYTSQ
jgi:hypothetical protein